MIFSGGLFPFLEKTFSSFYCRLTAERIGKYDPHGHQMQENPA